MPSFFDELYARTMERVPSEDVVIFVERNRPDLLKGPALDAGCGSGRHAIYMASRGITVHGLDESAVGIQRAQEWAAMDGRDIRFQQADIRRLPYSDAFFRGLVSWEAVFYGEAPTVKSGVAELFRVLGPGSPFLISFKSTGDFRCEDFPKSAPNTHQTDQGPMTFFDRSELEGLLTPLSEGLNIEVLLRTLQNGAKRRENLIATGRKA